MRYWSHAPWTTIAQANAAVDEARADHASGASVHYVIEQRSSGALIGSCALYAFLAQSRCATLGYLLSRPHWGQGYASEAMRVLLCHAFAELDLNRVEADVHPCNTGSAKALEKMGFLSEGLRRERWIVDGKKHDTAAYALLRRDWLAR
jgi:ribosomal-protein-alanine N-acetyltransferase